MALNPPPEAVDPAQTVRETVRGLVAPRRLIPILLVCLPLLVAQGHFSRSDGAVGLGLALCLAFVFVAPVSFRLLLPEGVLSTGAWLRLLLYAVLGAAIVFGLGLGIPEVFGMGASFLTAPVSLAVCAALFLVGGWGLGRDIGFEHGLARARARADALAREAERAQLLALRAQLDPHFLFNTLNSIAEWCREDGAVAERAVLQLSAMLRAVLGGVKAPAWPLRQELELAETLFALHRLRDPELFELRQEVDASLCEVQVPPLILLPLAENAAKHGPCSGHRGVIALAVRREAAELVVTLENPGTYAGPRPGSSGLPNLERRLALAYGSAAQLQIGKAGERTRVELRVPVCGPQTGVNA
ncbi:MAG: histidine kinase [Deltaproteobacteria bacterium]|nr:histidine kinase [Deltaproteobacteria bacterium]